MATTTLPAALATPHVAARDASIALRDLRVHLVACAPADARADVQRLIGEAEHHVACALAAAGVHPRARTVEEPSRSHGGNIAQTFAAQESTR